MSQQSSEEYYFDFDPGHTRTNRYPNENDTNFTDTTYYDKNTSFFDMSFQNLKKIHLNLHPEFAYLKILFIDHNELIELPDPKYLPNIEQLNC